MRHIVFTLKEEIKEEEENILKGVIEEKMDIRYVFDTRICFLKCTNFSNQEDKDISIKKSIGAEQDCF